MRWIFLILLILGCVLAAGGWVTYNYALSRPYQIYSEWMRGENYGRLYRINNYHPRLLAPEGVEELLAYREDYAQLWKQFPLAYANVPLPIRHPLYQLIPSIQAPENSPRPMYGFILQNPQGRQICRIHLMPLSTFKYHTQGQEFFKLPYIKNRLRAKASHELWKDIFSYVIEIKPKSTEEMIYDLYILHLRSQLLPPQVIRHGLLSEKGPAIIEVESSNKDYRVEIVLRENNGAIFSFLIQTEKEEIESQKLRTKFIQSITPSSIDESVAKILYAEFKQLNYARQIDQEGMLYLFSAWSQNPDESALLKEMISYLERGKDTNKQLKSLYQYALKKFGKTLSSSSGPISDDPELDLQRKIEIEQREKAKMQHNKQPPPTTVPELSAEEKMNQYLKQAKENKLRAKDEMAIP
jgi:hypothetical protein